MIMQTIPYGIFHLHSEEHGFVNFQHPQFVKCLIETTV